MVVQHLLGPTSFPTALSSVNFDCLSVLSYNVLLPNSVDGWWNYKMYSPDQSHWGTWDCRRELLRERIATVDADVVCFQEVAPVSFEEDFKFMELLGYDGKEMFKKGRFRPATFWKTSRAELVVPPVHKDRTLLTAFRLSSTVDDTGTGTADNDKDTKRLDRTTTWYVLNCHLQAGKEGGRRVRQMLEGTKAVLTAARKLKDEKPEDRVPLVVCGDFNGGSECGAVRFLEDGSVGEDFLEDEEPVTSKLKSLPLSSPMSDAMASVTTRPPPPTLVVAELISQMVQGDAYANPKLSDDILARLKRIYERFSTAEKDVGKVMGVADVERWLELINGQVGRGSEFRKAAELMGWKADPEDLREDGKPNVTLPKDGFLTLADFTAVYEDELRQGKFWGIAYDLAVMGEPLPDAGLFEARYDRMYCSAALEPVAVMDFASSRSCPNDHEPSDHLPVASAFRLRN